jgi:hypothetical protein
MAKDTRWDRNLSVAPDADGLIGHARGGAAAQAGRSVLPDVSARRGAGPEGEVPPINRGISLVSMAAAITLGARRVIRTLFASYMVGIV